MEKDDGYLRVSGVGSGHFDSAQHSRGCDSRADFTNLVVQQNPMLGSSPMDSTFCNLPHHVLPTAVVSNVSKYVPRSFHVRRDRTAQPKETNSLGLPLVELIHNCLVHADFFRIPTWSQCNTASA